MVHERRALPVLAVRRAHRRWPCPAMMVLTGPTSSIRATGRHPLHQRSMILGIRSRTSSIRRQSYDRCLTRKGRERRKMRRLLRIIPVLAAIQASTAISAFGFHLDPLPNPEPPFVVCENQQYALCAEASCFVYDGVAYCKCDIKNGDSISLQLSFSSPAGERNVCDVNRQGKNNGYMISTFSLPKSAEKGGTSAAYTCP